MRSVPSTPAASSRQPITNLEDAVQRALEADARATAAPAAARPRERPVPPRLNADAAVQRAVDAQKIAAAPAPPASTSSRFWFAALVVALIIGGVVFWLGLRVLEEDARQGTREGAAATDAPAPLEARRAAFTEALRALKDVQAASTPSVPYSTYSSRVAFAKSDVDRYLSTAATDAETDVRDAMDLHVLAVAAWKARTLDSKDAWEAVGQDPAIDRCPSAQRMIDVTETPTGQSRAYARGLGIAAAIPLLWECAGARVSRLEAAPSG